MLDDTDCLFNRPVKLPDPMLPSRLHPDPWGRRLPRPDKKMLLRCWLPYGRWACADGREVLFNRFYEPIWERTDGVTKRAIPAERVRWTDQSWFFNDGNLPWYDRQTLATCLRVLREFGATWEPIAQLRRGQKGGGLMYIIVLKRGLEPPRSGRRLRQSLRDQVPPPGRVRLSPMAAAEEDAAPGAGHRPRRLGGLYRDRLERDCLAVRSMAGFPD